MATYDPSEGRGEGIKIKYKINLPPDLKVTGSTISNSIPEKKQVPESYSRGDPEMKQVPSFFHSPTPLKASNAFTLTVSKPALQTRTGEFFRGEPVSANDVQHRKLYLDHPLLVYNVENVHKQQSVPLMQNDPGHTKCNIEKRPVYRSQNADVSLQWGKPRAASKSGSVLQQSVPLMANKTPSVLAKQVPVMSAKNGTTLEHNRPAMCNKTEAKLTFLKSVLASGTTDLEHNHSVMKDVPTTLEKTVPLLHLNPTELRHPHPDIKVVPSTLVATVPDILCREAELLHPKPAMLSKDFDYRQAVPLAQYNEEIFEHNTPELLDVPSQFEFSTPELEVQ